MHQVGLHYKDYQDARSAKQKKFNILSFPLGHPAAAYVFSLVFPSLLSFRLLQLHILGPSF
jgi:hypothetical protein